MKKYIFALALFFMVSGEQNIYSQLQELQPKILDELTQINPDSLPHIQEGQDMLKEKCKQNGNNETYQAVVEAKEEFQNCIKRLVDLEEIQEEIKIAKPKGDLDTVFKKYCRKSPQLKNCIVNFTNVAEECFNEEEKGTKDTALNITDSFINFICFKEGDRIALFMAEGGPECIMGKLEEIQACANSTFSRYVPEGGIETTDIPELVLDEAKCRDMSIVQKCIVKELESCTETTPANIFDSMFNFVRKSTPCAKFSSKSLGLDRGDSGSSRPMLQLFIITTSILFLLVL